MISLYAHDCLLSFLFDRNTPPPPPHTHTQIQKKTQKNNKNNKQQKETPLIRLCVFTEMRTEKSVLFESINSRIYVLYIHLFPLKKRISLR